MKPQIPFSQAQRLSVTLLQIIISHMLKFQRLVSLLVFVFLIEKRIVAPPSH